MISKTRNLVMKLSRISEAKHYDLTDHKNMLKTWEGIKLVLNINKRNKSVTCLSAYRWG